MLKVPSRDRDPPHMPAVGTSSADFLFGDDFDAIFEALDEDEEFEDYLEAVVEEVSV